MILPRRIIYKPESVFTYKDFRIIEGEKGHYVIQVWFLIWRDEHLLMCDDDTHAIEQFNRYKSTGCIYPIIS